MFLAQSLRSPCARALECFCSFQARGAASLSIRPCDSPGSVGAVERSTRVAVSDEQQSYLSYLLRLWQEPVTRPAAWRASLQNPQTGELLGFADTAQLFAFLEQQLAAATTRTRRVAGRPHSAYARPGESTPVPQGLAPPAAEEHRGPRADSAPAAGSPASDE